MSCGAVVARFFPGENDPYEPESKRVSAPADVERCCADALSLPGAGGSAATGARTMPAEDVAAIFSRYRWRCCTVVDTPAHPQVACSPWGPPVPPRMDRFASRALHA